MNSPVSFRADRGAWRYTLGIGLIWLGAATFASGAQAAPPSEPDPAPAAADDTVDTPDEAPSVDAPPRPRDAPEADDDAEGARAPDLVDTTLPSGLRVLVARDRSLPVAAVVLAIETGTRDDPPELGGLHHALAYQLQQGNRELRPQAILDAVHARGGMATMAVGTAQVRFASIVPASFLDRVLDLELSRLRVPSIDERRWKQSVSRARSDRNPGAAVPGEALAAVWGDEALTRDRRRPEKRLRELDPKRIAEVLRTDFNYPNATLTVVSPEPPAEVFARIEALARDLPPHPREVPEGGHQPPPSTTTGARPVAVKGGKGRTFVWAVPGHAEGIFSARVVCGVLNRQSPGAEQPKAKIRCVMHEDPRRPAMSVRVENGGDAPAATLAARLDRIAAALDDTGQASPPPAPAPAKVEAIDEDSNDGATDPDVAPPDNTAKLLAEQRARQAQALIRVSSTPLGLARLLAFTPAHGPASSKTTRSMRVMTGAASLSDPAGPARVVPELLSIDAAVRLVDLRDPPATKQAPPEPIDNDARRLDEDEADPDAADPQEDVH